MHNDPREITLKLSGDRLYICQDRGAVRFNIDITPVWEFFKEVNANELKQISQVKTNK